MSWWGLAALVLVSGLLLGPLAFGFALGYRRLTEPPDRFARLAVATLLTERTGLVVAVWLAAFSQSLWIVAGVLPFIAATRLCLRWIGLSEERVGNGLPPRKTDEGAG